MLTRASRFQGATLLRGFGQALALIQPLQATVQEPGLQFLKIEYAFHLLQRLLMIEGQTGNYVDVNVVAPKLLKNRWKIWKLMRLFVVI